MVFQSKVCLRGFSCTIDFKGLLKPVECTMRRNGLLP